MKNREKLSEFCAINATEIKVQFNKAIDPATAADLSNYVLSINNAKYDYADPADQYDYLDIKTILVNDNGTNVLVDGIGEDYVILKLEAVNPLADGDDYTVEVKDGVLSADGEQVVRYGEVQKEFDDEVAPKLVSAELVGTDLELLFDEPVQTGFEVTVDGVVVPAATVSTLAEDYTATIDLSANEELIAVGTHNVIVYNVLDYTRTNGNNGNRAALLTASYNVVEEDTQQVAPEVIAITPVDFNSLYVTFSEPVDEATIVVTKGTTEFHNVKYTSAADLDESYIDENDELVENSALIDLPFTVESERYGLTYLYNAGETSANVNVVVKDYRDVNDDLLGYAESAVVTLERDSNLPVVDDEYTKVINDDDVEEADQLEIVFNRGSLLSTDDTDETKLDLNKIVVKDKDGISRTIASATIVDDAIVITLTKDGAVLTNKDIKAMAPFTVDFKADLVKVETDFVDMNSPKADGTEYDSAIPENTNELKNLAQTTSVVVVGTSDPGENGYKAVEAVNTVVETDNVITVTYKEVMGASAANLSNYTLDGAQMPFGTSITMDGANKVVTITLPQEYFAKNVQKKLVISDDVTTKLGSHVVGNVATKEVYMSGLLSFTDNVKPVLAKAEFVAPASATTTTAIRLTFSEEILNADGATVDIANYKVVAHDNTEATIESAVVETITVAGKSVKVVTLTLSAVDAVNMSQTTTVTVVAKPAVVQTITDLAGNELTEGTVKTVSGKVQ